MTLISPSGLLCSLAAVALAACTADDPRSRDEEPVPVRPAPRVALLIPGSDTASVTAPAVFRVKFETSKGDFVVEVHRDWAPHGADRFYYLVRNGFYDEVRFFRVLQGFIAQFGISGDPKLSAVWRVQAMHDDPVIESNKRGFLSYVQGGPGTRSTQVFVNYADNSRLDRMGYAAFARVIAGMEVVDQLYAGYGEAGPAGRGPDQGRIRREGNAYLTSHFPKLDYVTRATVVEPQNVDDPRER